ncbi:hypothetical protein GOP47_0000750 [Adiantum capillus-veneris]|uniref:DDE Tnp4 domain-containing protein n=1 Tax=Adiantum capillus-veneris TaxID=13818 RepID=A0A9D4ZSK8_ADICA|nr:hypothetical protein GOP47_0000750 [Adiantum capillus-veneris]
MIKNVFKGYRLAPDVDTTNHHATNCFIYKSNALDALPFLPSHSTASAESTTLHSHRLAISKPTITKPLECIIGAKLACWTCFHEAHNIQDRNTFGVGEFGEEVALTSRFKTKSFHPCQLITLQQQTKTTTQLADHRGMDLRMHLQATIPSINTLMSALLHEWESLHGQSTSAMHHEEEEMEFEEYVAPYLPLLWAASSAQRTPRYEGSINDALGRWIFTVEKKVAIAVMVHQETHYHVANAFGCGRSTVTTFLHEFVCSLVHRGGHLIKWPTTESEMRDVKDGFRALRGLPNFCGAIDCTHINMDLPRNEQSEPWRDRYGNYSMIMQGIVDSNMRFLDVNSGWPGSCNDKRVLRNSGMYRLCQGGDRLRGASFEFQEFSFPEYIIDDGGYVLLPWLMIPFQRPELCTWQILKGTIRSPDIQKLPNVILACCILHNMLVSLTDEPVDLQEHEIDLKDPLVDNPHAFDGIVEATLFLDSSLKHLMKILRSRRWKSNLAIKLGGVN